MFKGNTDENKAREYLSLLTIALYKVLIIRQVFLQKLSLIILPRLPC